MINLDGLSKVTISRTEESGLLNREYLGLISGLVVNGQTDLPYIHHVKKLSNLIDDVYALVIDKSRNYQDLLTDLIAQAIKDDTQMDFYMLKKDTSAYILLKRFMEIEDDKKFIEQFLGGFECNNKIYFYVQNDGRFFVPEDYCIFGGNGDGEAFQKFENWYRNLTKTTVVVNN